jgi:hypothetical protein
MLTPYQKRQKDEDFTFDVFSVEIPIEKEQKKEVKNVFKTNVSSQKIRMRKEEGATVAATPTFPQLAVSSGRTGSVLPWKDPKQWETPINY